MNNFENVSPEQKNSAGHPRRISFCCIFVLIAGLIVFPFAISKVSRAENVGVTPPSPFNLENLKEKVSFLEQYWAHEPPMLINLPPRLEKEGDCIAGQLLFTKAGRYPIEIPAACTHVLVKAWGSTGGGKNAGAGGFSMGLLDIPQGAKLEAIIGESGRHIAIRNNNANPPPPGVYRNGDGEGISGGDTELLINGSPVLVAGGGKPVNPGEMRGFPGGGRKKEDLLDTKSTFYLSTDTGDLGITPEYGVTLWGDANTRDPDYEAVASNGDGEVALIWPAPTPGQFLTSIAAAGADVFKSMQPRQEAVDASGRMIIKDSAYHDQHCKYNVGILDSAIDATGHMVMRAACLENSAPAEYKPRISENITAYEGFIGGLRQKEQEQNKQQEMMLKQMQAYYQNQPGIMDKVQAEEPALPSSADLMSPLVKLMEEAKLPTEFVHHESHDYKMTNDVYVIAPLDLNKKSDINARHATIRLKNDLRLPETVEIFESGWGTYRVRENSCEVLEKGKPIYVLSSWAHANLLIPAMNLIKTDYQYPYTYTNFIVFGRGISSNDIITQGNQIIDTKTKDTIQFTSKPCVNIVFSER